MIIGELCESCNEFNRGRYSVVECSICENDMCNLCGNDFLCPNCFEKKKNGTLGADPEIEGGFLTGWRKRKNEIS